MKQMIDMTQPAPMFSAIERSVADPGFFTAQVGAGSRRATLEEET